MDDKINILKMQGYDDFKCTADKCKFTCCAGWDIGIDDETYDKWKSENHSTEYILKNVIKRKCGKREEFLINKEIHESCPLLDSHGLCQVVKNHGEDYLSMTCRTFPRVENIFGENRELSLSCACPEVVESISNIKGKLVLDSEVAEDIDTDLLEVKLRHRLIKIIQHENFHLDNKLVVGYQLLMELIRYKNFGKGALLNSIEKYKSVETIEEVINDCAALDEDLEGSIEEINYLLVDIIENYKEVEGLQELLKDIYDYAEEADLGELAANWHDFKDSFKKYDRLMENCIISKVLTNCVSSDLKEMTIAFQLIILEYLLVRYAVFIKSSISGDNEINLQHIKDYIVAFSRVIGNNSEATVEFINDGFGDSIIDIGYLCFISLF